MLPVSFRAVGRSVVCAATAFALVLSAYGAASSDSAVEFPPKAPASATLKDTFKDAFLVGAALSPRQFLGKDQQASAFVTREFNCATAENAMKWESLEPRNNQFRFEQADRFIDYCRSNNLVIVGHNLCWHAQLPSWVSKPDPGQETLTKEVLLARLKNHIFTVAGHFKGKVHGWDVVNEAINDGDGAYRNSVFYRVIGKEYLPLAFKWAHEADPDAELYYNDYNLDADDAKRATAVELVKYLREQGAPIHGIGLQGHYNLSSPTPAKIDETIQIFADLGLKVMITELDVEVLHESHVTGAVGATTGASTQQRANNRPRPRLFPTADKLKTEMQLSDAQLAQITSIIDAATKNIGDAIAAAEYNRIGDIRTESTDAIRQLLSESQQAKFTELMAMPPLGPPPPPLTPAEQQELARRYGEIFDVFLKHRKAITRVTFWGVRDADSWRRRSSPLLFDDNYGRKPAYDAVIASARKAGL
jgi:endo-1,4-beta-xylanase